MLDSNCLFKFMFNWFRKFVLTISLLHLVSCNTGIDRPEPTPLPPQTNHFFKAIWTTSVGVGTLGKNLSLAPAIFDGIVYVVNNKGQVSAVDAYTGKVIWRKNYKVSASSDMGVSHSYLMFGTLDAQVLLVNRFTGKLIWKSRVSNEIHAKPIFYQGKVIVRAIDSTITAFDEYSGKVMWSYREDKPEIAIQSNSSPLVIKGGALYFGLPNGQLIAVSAATGKLLWQETLSDYHVGEPSIEKMIDINVQPVTFSNKLYVGGYYGKLSAINLDTRKVIWNINHNIQTLSLEVDNNYIYAIDNYSRIWKFDRITGQVLWKREDLLYRYITSPILYRDKLLVGDSEGYFLTLNKSNGKFVSKMRIDDCGIITSPLIYKERILILTTRGTLISLIPRYS